jgi:rubrerythrin
MENIEADYKKLRKKLITYQRSEITEYHIYMKLAKTGRSEANRKILIKIAEDERRHYDAFKKYTLKDIKPIT